MTTTSQQTTPPQSTPEVSGYRWVMLLLMCLVYGSFGLVSQSLAPLVPLILHDLDITRTTMGFILGSWQFVYLFVAIPAGAIIDKFGLRRSMLMGIGFVALSQMIRAGAVHPLILLAGVMVFGLGGPFISVGAPKLTSLWFPQKEIGMALGIYTISPSIGSMISNATANSVVMPLTGNSWHLTLLCFAGIAVMAAVAWLIFARDPEVPKGGPPAATTTMFSAFKMLLGFPVVRLILVMATGTFLFNHSFNNWLNTILISQGMTATDAGFWAAFPTIIAIVAALTVPRFTTQKWLVPVQVVMFALWAVSALMIAFTTGPLQYLGLVLLGFGRGASTPLLMLTLLRSPQVGPALMGAAGGLFFTAGEVGGVLGPSMTGMLADATGDYNVGIIALAAVSFGLALLSFPLGAAAGAAGKKEEQGAKA